MEEYAPPFDPTQVGDLFEDAVAIRRSLQEEATPEVETFRAALLNVEAAAAGLIGVQEDDDYA